MLTRKKIYDMILAKYDFMLTNKFDRTEFIMMPPENGVICGMLFDRTGEKNVFRLEVFAQVPVCPRKYLALGSVDDLLRLVWDFETCKLKASAEQIKFEQCNVSFPDYILKTVDDICLPWIRDRLTPGALFLATPRPVASSGYNKSKWPIRSIARAIDYCYICLAANKYKDAQDLIIEICEYFEINKFELDENLILSKQIEKLKEINNILAADPKNRADWISCHESITLSALGIR